MDVSAPVDFSSRYLGSVVLSPVSWETYERLLDELGEGAAVHLTYNTGCLEIMNPPLPIHEENASLLHDFIRILCEELNVDIRSFRSTTLRRKDLEKGVEPDNCYYIRHAAEVAARQDRRNLDLNQLPPPDLVVEVDITASSLDKLSLYKAFNREKQPCCGSFVSGYKNSTTRTAKQKRRFY